MWVNNLDFKQCLIEVGEYLGVEKEDNQTQQPSVKPAQVPVQASPVQQGPVMVNNKLREGKPHKVVSGTLIAHGQAPFDHKEENELNYFAVLRTKSNHERTCWEWILSRPLVNVVLNWAKTSS